MTDYSYSAYADINRYIWNQLTASGVLSSSSYISGITGGVILPFTPAQEEPLIANTFDDNPYFVFDVLTTQNSTSSSDAWWVERDELTYVIYGPDLNKINQIINVIKESCRRMDESAKQVNRTSGISGKYWFQTVSVEWVEQAEPSKSEAGRLSASIQICYNYARVEDSDGLYV
jgi:hypothetical protein